MASYVGVYVDDLRAFLRPSDEESEDRDPLGQRIRGLAGDRDVDAVESVRELRERRRNTDRRGGTDGRR